MGHRFHGRTYVSECVCLGSAPYTSSSVLIEVPCVKILHRTYATLGGVPRECFCASCCGACKIDMPTCCELRVLVCLCVWGDRHVWYYCRTLVDSMKDAVSQWWRRSHNRVARADYVPGLAAKRSQWGDISDPLIHVSGNIIRIRTPRRRFDGDRDSILKVRARGTPTRVAYARRKILTQGTY